MTALLIAELAVDAPLIGVGAWTVGGWIGSAIRQRQRRSLARRIDAVIARRRAEEQGQASRRYLPAAFPEPTDRRP